MSLDPMHGGGVNMLESPASNRSPKHPLLKSSGKLLWVGFGIVALLIGLRAASEYAMMSEHGTDPQMGIWLMFMVLKLAFWLVTGVFVMSLLFAMRQSRFRMAASIMLLAWSVAIGWASWQYHQGAQALAEAADPSTSPARLQELVSFAGIQAGYELDNRLASHPSTPIEGLRKLYERDQAGTQMRLAGNPNTPQDILQQLVNHEDEWVRRSLRDNPRLPEAVRRKMEERSK